MKKILFLFFCISQVALAQNLTPFKQGDLYGYRLEKSIQIEPKFEYSLNFSEGVALVKFKGKWGYIDSTGMWTIQPIYQKGSPFKDGQAFVNLDGKIGLIRKDGSYLLEAKFDEIARNEYGYELKQGNFVGLYSAEFDEYIEPKYSSISKRGVFTSCLRSDQYWDIYKNGLPFIEKADRQLKANDVDNNYVTFYVNGKKGLYYYDKGWLFEPKYLEIERFDAYEYSTANNSYTFGFWLTLNREWHQDPDLGEIISFQLATGDGNLISPEIFDFAKSNFNAYDAENGCIACMELKSKEQSFIMTSDLKIVPFDYVYLRHQAGRLLGSLGETTFIFDKTLTKIDSFNTVEPISFMELIENEFGETEVLPVVHSNYEVVWVSKKENKAILHALYDLKKSRVISDWFASNTDFGFEKIEVNNQTILLVKNADNLYSFYNEVMDKMGNFNFTSLTPTIDNYMVGVNSKTNLSTVFSVKPESIKPIAETFKAYNSRYLRREEFSENDDVIYYQFFEKDFVVLEDQTGRFGLITNNQRVFLPQFDSIHPNAGGGEFITTRLNGKFGLIHLYFNTQIPPTNDQPFEPFFVDSLSSYFVQIGSGETAYYLNLNGRKLKSLSPKIEILKDKKLVGIQTNNDFDPADKFITVQPVFKSLTSVGGNNYIAQNTSKKFGMINYLGDTIVPFNYSKIEFYTMDNTNQEWMYYKIYQGKNVGISSNFSGVIFDAQYSSISILEGAGWLSTAFTLEKKGRFGLGDYSGQIIMDCIYDQVQQINLGRSTELGMYEGKIGSKLYVQPVYYLEKGFYKINENLRPYDLIVGENGYIKNGEFYEKYSLANNTFIGKTTNLDETYSNGEYILSFKNGKWGALDFEGNQLIDYLYDDASFMQDRSEIMIGYENGVKYYIYVFTKERYTEDQW